MSSSYIPSSDPYLQSLRRALKATFAANPVIQALDADSVATNAGVMGMFAQITVSFHSHIRKDVILQMIAQVDTSDDPDMAALQAQLLSLPEWTTDTSDAS